MVLKHREGGWVWGCCDTLQIIFLRRHQSVNEASKVLEQGLLQNKFAIAKPRAMGF